MNDALVPGSGQKDRGTLSRSNTRAYLELPLCISKYTFRSCRSVLVTVINPRIPALNCHCGQHIQGSDVDHAMCCCKLSGAHGKRREYLKTALRLGGGSSTVVESEYIALAGEGYALGFCIDTLSSILCIWIHLNYPRHMLLQMY